MSSFFSYLFRGMVAVVTGWLTWYMYATDRVWRWFKDLLISLWNEFWSYFMGVLPPGFASLIEGISWKDGIVLQWLTDLSWILPIVPALTLWGTAYSVCAFLRLLRWVKSFVPTMSGA